MSLRTVLVFAGLLIGGGLVAAAPDAKKEPAPPLPPAAGSAAGSGSGAGSAAVPNPEDEPPKDMNGTDENPDAPKTGVGDANEVKAVAPTPSPRTGYPTEEVLRPITLPQNMSEVGLGPHLEISNDARQGYNGGDALRARYGITRQVQLGLTYVFAGIYHDPSKVDPMTMEGPLGVHGGKAVGLDLTVALQDWLAVRVGVPVYISPVAVSLQLGAPIKVVVFDKLAIGGLEDILNIKLKRFAPSFDNEFDNARAAFETGPGGNNTQQPAGTLKISAFAEYQMSADLAVLGRIGFINDLGGGGSSAGTGTPASGATFLKAGLQITPRKWIDLGLMLGFDDLAHGGTFGPQGILNVRI